MVAVAHLSQARPRRLVVVRSTPRPRPHPTGPTAATYRRRRTVAVVVAACVVLALSLAARSVLAGARAAAGPRPVPERPAMSGPVHVVAPGDTFWDIARMLRPHHDPRPLVARMVAAHGSPFLVVGERIPLPDEG